MKRAHDVANARAREDIVVEIAVVDLGVAVEAVVVVELAAEIERRVRQRVVEEPVATPDVGVAADQERPVLVQRIATSRAL